MTKKLKIWMVVLSVASFVCGGAAFMPALHPLRAQDTPQLTQAEALTIELLRSILGELVELNHNIERLPAPTAP